MDFQTVINLSDKTSWHTRSTCCRRHCDPAVGGGAWRHRTGSVCLSGKSGEGDPRITTWKGEKFKEFYLQTDHFSLETIKVRSRCLVPSSVALTSSPRVWRSHHGAVQMWRSQGKEPFSFMWHFPAAFTHVLGPDAHNHL